MTTWSAFVLVYVSDNHDYFGAFGAFIGNMGRIIHDNQKGLGELFPHITN